MRAEDLLGVGGWHVEGRGWGDPKKERDAFAVLVNRLRALKWQRDALADPVKGPKLRARKRAHQLLPASVAKRLAGERRRRISRAKLRPAVRCACCGVEFCRVPTVRGSRPRFCSALCRERARRVRDKRKDRVNR